VIYTIDTDVMRLVSVCGTLEEAEASVARGTYNYYCFDESSYLEYFNTKQLIMLLRHLGETPSFTWSTPGAKHLAMVRVWESLTSRKKDVYT